MMNTDTKQQIETALRAFSGSDLRAASIGLLNSLGYESEKTLGLGNTPDAFIAEFDKRDRKFRTDKAQFERWKSVEFLFQITDDEVRNAGVQSTLFDSGYDHGNYQSYLFFALDLKKNHYTRTQLADITREINLLFDMPAMLLIRHNGALTFSIIDRRLHKKDQSRDVLEKVKLIKDIRYQDPHRAHIEILHDLALPTLMAKHECRDFKQLHEAWRTTLDTNELNKKFYRELADWYFWALDHVEYPSDVEKDTATRNATNVIRLLTRLIFCWFLKEKGLIPAELFSERKLAGVLKSLKDDDSTFYRAILQNLFFGTLNQRMNIGGRENRRFANDGSFLERKDEYGVKNLYRYQKLFAIAEEEAVNLFSDIPFMNGGLFDCLDKEDDSGKVIYVDGFTRNARKQPKVPNFLFFSDYRTLDLSDAYGDKKKKKEKVRGLINLLDSYKFTVTENTPIEEEIALDPELLGKVFENLLASYNPETGTTARKQTGSFYTPREIVNYMVDESLIAYLEGQLKAMVPKLAEMKDLQDLLREVFAYTEKAHPFDEDEVEALIDAIDNCKILDPACGSGAFPMGILHKLVFILGKIDLHNERWKKKQIAKAEQIPDVSAREIAVGAIEKDFETNDLDYGRKLYLIENCIYGVDIQPIAIQISKLRFFISLICDQRTNKNKAQNCGVRPLPNLETKFVAANTLISLDREKGQQLPLTDPRLPILEKKLAAVRHRYFAAQRRRDKLTLQKRDAEIREEISSVLAGRGMSGEASKRLAAWDPYDQNTSAQFFDPEWMYGITDGFDVVIGNPPYVSHDQLTNKNRLRTFAVYEPFADLYCYFIEKSVKLTSVNGATCLITSNSFIKADYGKPLRQFLVACAPIEKLLNVEDSQVFKSAIVNVAILLAHKGRKAGRVLITNEKCTDENFRQYVASKAFFLTPAAFKDSEWILIAQAQLDVHNKLKAQGRALMEMNSFIRLGLATGANQAFIISKTQANAFIEADPKNREIIKPILRGREIDRYIEPESTNFVLLAKNGVNVPRDYPEIYQHLDGFGSKFKKRGAQGQNWWNLRACAFYHKFKLPKVVWIELTDRARFTYCDKNEMYLLNSAYFLVPPESVSVKFLTGILNSKCVDFFFNNIAATSGMGTTRWINAYVKQLPIPSATEAQQFQIEQLVEKIRAVKNKQPNSDVTTIEAKIDQLVYKLYDLTADEIAIVEDKSV